MPAKSANPADTSKPARKRTASPRRASAKPARPDQGDIAQRAYFIHLEEGSSDELANWLRAERELTAV